MMYTTSLSLIFILHQWYVLAKEVAIDLASSCSRNTCGWHCSSLLEKDALRIPGHNLSPKCQSTGGFKCGKEWHCATKCRVTKATPKSGGNTWKKLGKLTPRTREMALEGVEVVEFSLPSYGDWGTLPTPERSNTDSKDDLQVSRLVIPITISVKLVVPLSGAQGKVLALLDLCYIRCMVNPEVMEKLGLRLQQLRVPTAFCQLDGTVARGALAHFITDPVEMWMENHWETLSFIMSLGLERPLLLGLACLQKWNLYVNWQKSLLKIQ